MEEDGILADTQVIHATPGDLITEDVLIIEDVPITDGVITNALQTFAIAII